MNAQKLKMMIIILLPWSVFPLVQITGLFDLRFWLTPTALGRILKIFPMMIYLFGCMLSTFLLLDKWNYELVVPVEEALKRKKQEVAKQSGIIRPLVALIFLPSYLLAIAASILIHVPIYKWMVSLEGKEAVGEIGKKLYLIVAGICVVVTIYLVIRSFLREKLNSHSILLTYDDCPQIYQVVYNICKHIGAIPPNQIVLEWSANFYVTEFKMIIFKHMLHKRTLCISAPLLPILTQEEFIAIVAHEMAHFSGHDTLYGKIFYPVYRGVESSLGAYATALYSTRNIIGYLGFVALALFIPTIFLYLFYSIFKFVEKGIGRQRELRADTIAAGLINAESMGTALIKSIIGANVWNKTYSEWVKSIAAEKDDYNILNNFLQKLPKTGNEMYDVLTNEKNPCKYLDTDDQYKSHPFDTHPTIHKRMLNLGLIGWDKQTYYDGMVHGSIQLILDLQPSRNAQIFVPGHYTKNAELSRLEKDFINKKYNS